MYGHQKQKKVVMYLFAGVMVVSCLFGLKDGLVFANVGSTILVDSFNDYPYGYSLNENEVWENSDETWLITSLGCFLGNCAAITGLTGDALGYSTSTATSGLDNLYIQQGGTYQKAIIVKSDTGNKIFLKLYWDDDHWELWNNKGVSEAKIINVPNEVWWNLSLMWDCTQGDSGMIGFKVAIDGGSLTDWLTGYSACSEESVPNGYQFSTYTDEGWLAIDEINTLEIYPSPFELEDCSEYDLLERLICEIKNLISGIFLPSGEKLTELKNTIFAVKQRAPYNYIEATQNFVASVGTELSTTTPTISILGATGTLNFGLFNTTTTFAGSEQNIGLMIRNFLALMFILGFVAWGIGYLRRIFK